MDMLTRVLLPQGSILILSYLTVMMGFYFSSFANHVEISHLSLGMGSKGYDSGNVPNMQLA